MDHPTEDADTMVYILSERTWATVVSLGAHFCRVKYNIGGIEYEVYVDNDDLVFTDRMDIDAL